MTAITSSAASAPRISYDPAAVQRFTLNNGLRVWIEPRPDSESITALLVVRVGSRYETPANNGISHFVEHMVFDGTEKWPTEEAVADAITHRGGNWNGWTDEETTTYFVQLAQRDFDLALDWLSQIVFHPTFPADKVNKERGIIFEEKFGRYGWLLNTLDALGLGYELDRDIRRALFPGSTLSLRIIGEDASLDKITRPSLLEYYHTHYRPENSALIIVGQVGQTSAREKVDRYFGPLPGGPAQPIGAERADPPLPPRGPQHVTVRGPFPTDQSIVDIGMRTVNAAHLDRWPLEVLAEVMEEDLMKEIRYRRGLAYGLSAFNQQFDDVGYFGIVTQVESSKRAEVQRAIKQYYERVRRGAITAEQVSNAQAALIGRWALEMEDGTRRAAWLAEWAFASGDQPIPDYAAAIQAVTVSDLQRMVETYYTPARRYAGLHHPIMTVPRGGRLMGVAAGLSIVFWLWRRLRR
jgi:predicted Zn-dependent peptidase